MFRLGIYTEVGACRTYDGAKMRKIVVGKPKGRPIHGCKWKEKILKLVGLM